MALIAPDNDYTSRDFDALRIRLQVLVRSVFSEWSDFSVASFGNILLEMYAFVGDVLSFYIDNQGRESRLATATQRKNVIALARMLGYELRGATAARAQVKFSLTRVPEADVKIPAGTMVRTQEVVDPARFELLEDVSVTVGQNPPEITGEVEHSRSYTQRVDTRGLVGSTIFLDHLPYLDESARVQANNGAFKVVESFLSSGPNDRHVTIQVDSNDRARVRFGDGTSGLPPTGTVRVDYRTGGGPSGNVDAGRLVVIEGSFRDANGRPVQVKVTNPEPAQGGATRESIEEARLRVPESLRATSRTVTREDFEIHARQVPGVARALMLTSNEDRSIAENSGVLFIVPVGGGLPTPALRRQVFRQVTEVYPCTLTFQVSVQEPLYRTVDIDARIFLKPGVPGVVVRERIRSWLDEMFRLANFDGTANTQVDFGFNLRAAETTLHGEVAWSDVFNTIRDTPGVRKIGAGPHDLKLNGLATDVRIGLAEFPMLGDITLCDGTTGGLL